MQLTVILFALFQIAQGVAGLALGFLALLVLVFLSGLLVRVLTHPAGVK